MDADTDDIDELIRKLEAKLDDLGSLAGSLTQTVESSGTKLKYNIVVGGEKLSKENWATWKVRIKSQLSYYECLEAIETKLENDSEKNIRAQYIIINSLGKSVLGLLELSENALDLWESITEQFEYTHSDMIIEMFRKLSGTRLNEYAKTEEHLTKLRSYFNEINAVEKILFPKAFIYMVFQSLDVNFNTPQIAISNKEIPEDIDYFMRRLVSEAQSILSKNNITTSTMNLANYTKSSWKKTNESKICKFCKKPGHLMNVIKKSY